MGRLGHDERLSRPLDPETSRRQEEKEEEEEFAQPAPDVDSPQWKSQHNFYMHESRSNSVDRSWEDSEVSGELQLKVQKQEELGNEENTFRLLHKGSVIPERSSIPLGTELVRLLDNVRLDEEEYKERRAVQSGVEQLSPDEGTVAAQFDKVSRPNMCCG